MIVRSILSILIPGLMLVGGFLKPQQETVFIVTNTNDNGPGSLREAIDLANSTAGNDLIRFNLSGTIVLESPLPAIVDGLLITATGQDIAIDGQGSQRHFDLTSDETLQLVGLTLQNGFSDAEGGAVRSDGILVIEDCRFEGNQAITGGAIYASGPLEARGGSVFILNQADTGGAIFSSGDLQVTDTSFTNNQAVSLEGGAIYTTGNLAEMEDVTFVENTAINEGAAIYRTGNLTILRSEFSGNYSWSGALHIRSGSLFLENANFASNVANTNGAAISGIGSSVGISSGQFSDNQAINGGAIHLMTSGRVDLYWVTFLGNHATETGGAIYLDPTISGTIRSATFENNQAGSTGGAVFNAGNLNLGSVLLTQNHAFLYGGALVNQGSMMIHASNFMNNDSADAGAIENQAGADLVIDETSFKNNQAYSAGAIRNRGNLDMLQCAFDTNHADLGGALINDWAATFEEVTFNHNEAFDAGAILNSGDMYIHASVFTSNRSWMDYGGAILNHGDLTIEASDFLGNFNWNGGGAIYNTGPLVIQGGLFRGNGAKWGGAINNWSSFPAVIRSATFESNYAGHWGGAILNNASMQIEKCVFNLNRAEEFSGGVHNSGTMLLANSTLYGNRSGRSGGGIENWANLTLENNTLTGNISFEGGAAIHNNHTAVVRHVTISANTIEGVEGGTSIYNSGVFKMEHSIIADTTGGENCTGITPQASPSLADDASCPGFMVANPLLGPLQENGGTPTQALLPGSPAVDAATGAACPDSDQRGVYRPQGLACDLGAFEASQLVVSIDIQPKSTNNVIDLNSRGTIAVAVLSTPYFNAPLQVNASSLTFGATGWEVKPVTMLPYGKLLCSRANVNGDNLQDLICTIPVQGTNFTCGNQRGILRGMLNYGEWLVGVDIITPRPCP